MYSRNDTINATIGGNQIMNTLEYLTIYDKVLDHITWIFQDKTLPPGTIDFNARMRAQDEALMLHRGNNLIKYYDRMKAGAV